MASLLDHHQELKFRTYLYDHQGFKHLRTTDHQMIQGVDAFFFFFQRGSCLYGEARFWRCFFQVLICFFKSLFAMKRGEPSVKERIEVYLSTVFTIYIEIEQRWVQTRHVPAIQNVCWAPHEKPKIATRGQLALCFRSHQCKGIEGIRSEKMVTEPTVWAVMSTASSRFK